MLTKSPEIKEQCHNHTWHSASARQAFKVILGNLKEEGFKLLLPGYIGITDREGSGVFDPVSETGVDHDFYPLDSHLSMNRSIVQSQLESGKFGAILVIHYFGFCQTNMAWLKNTCNKNDITIIEDCAHTFDGFIEEGKLGELGDYSIYALHKVLPVSTGGMLRCNVANDNFSVSGLELPEATILNQLATTDISQTTKIRYRNYQHWIKHLSNLPGIKPMYPTLESGTAPHNFPVIIGFGLREKLYFALIEENIPVVALYYRMIPNLPKKGFESAHFVSQNILNFPVHQDITLDEIESMCVTISLKMAELCKK